MYQILKKRPLNEQVVLMEIEAPFVARKCQAGQFIILRTDETGERVPFTVAQWDREKGSVTIIFQIVGKTTMQLSEMNEGDSLSDFVGPLGKPSELEGVKRAAVIGGGLGCAIAYPQAQALHQMGAKVDIIAGFRTKDLIILEEEMKAACDNLYMMTDDGSNGNKGFVTNKLKELLEAGEQYDVVIAIGPLIMMKFVCATTKPFGVKTVISMNSIMVDGTGMCGCCRLTVDGKTQFACVDGPDFDGQLVDFDEVIKRNATYKEQEQAAVQKHRCRLTGEVR